MSSPVTPPDPSKRLVRWKRHLRTAPRARRRLVRAVGSGTLLLALGLAPFASLRAPVAQAAPLSLLQAARPAPAIFDRTSNFPAQIELEDLDGSNGSKLEGAASTDRAGAAVSDAGDVNGDGFDDLIVGAPFAAPNGFISGKTYVVFGGAAGFPYDLDLVTLDGTEGFRLEGAAFFNVAGLCGERGGRCEWRWFR